MSKPLSDKTQDKINHMRGEITRTRTRITELEQELMLARGSLDMARQDWAYVCGKLQCMSGREPFEDTIPEAYRRYYRTGYEEAQAAIVPGYEPYTPAAIAAIRSTVQTQADRAGQTQSEVFERAALRLIRAQTSAEDPPPHKDDA